MKRKILKRQENSRMCLVCGMENGLGLKAKYYELEGGELAAVFTPCEEHQSYPGRMHGGISGAILDETIGRAIRISQPDTWGVTIELNLKYRKPVPLDGELRVVARVTKDTSRIFEGTGELLLPSGEVAVTASGRYMKLPLSKIADFDTEREAWQVIESGEDPEELEL